MTAATVQRADIKGLIRTIPNFPKPGILFRDVSTLFKDAAGLKKTFDLLAELYAHERIEQVVAIESRGFILGGGLAPRLNAGLIMARKRGKLPGTVEEVTYHLEYGTDCIQIHSDAIKKGERCLIIDDLLATGGTANATAQLVERLGGLVVGCGFIVNLPELKGAERLLRYDPKWLVDFDGH